MLVTPNWKPHVYTDEELDLILASGSGSLEDFAALCKREYLRLSLEERKLLKLKTQTERIQ